MVQAANCGLVLCRIGLRQHDGFGLLRLGLVVENAGSCAMTVQAQGLCSAQKERGEEYVLVSGGSVPCSGKRCCVWFVGVLLSQIFFARTKSKFRNRGSAVGRQFDVAGARAVRSRLSLGSGDLVSDG